MAISSDVSAIFERALARYRPGGEYGKGTEAALERGRVKAVSTGMQSLVSAGLAGTTMAGGLGKKYEEEVAAPARARVEETRAERMSAIEMALASIIQQAIEAQKTRETQEEALSTQLGARERETLYGRRERSRLASQAVWKKRAPWMYGEETPDTEDTDTEDTGGYGGDYGGVGRSYGGFGGSFGGRAGDLRPTRMQSLAQTAQKWLVE